jgi:cytochrome c oxidase assembly factor CtaG
MTTAALAHAATADQRPWTGLAVLIAVSGLGAAYGRGIQQIWIQRGVGAVVSTGRVICFAGGLLAVAVSESPPVHEATERSFAIHMAQHMAIIVVAAPLLAAGCAGLPLTVACRPRVRRILGRARASAAGQWLRRPTHRAIASTLLLTASVVVWHLPRPFVVAEHHEVVHAVEHGCLLAPAWLVWACAVGHKRSVLPGFARPVLVVVASAPSALLGIALALLPQPVYPPSVLGVGGSDPLAAQQLGGVVMWAPMEIVSLAAAVAVAGRWLAALQRRAPSHSDLAAPALHADRTSDRRG